MAPSKKFLQSVRKSAMKVCCLNKVQTRRFKAAHGMVPAVLPSSFLRTPDVLDELNFGPQQNNEEDIDMIGNEAINMSRPVFHQFFRLVGAGEHITTGKEESTSSRRVTKKVVAPTSLGRKQELVELRNKMRVWSVRAEAANKLKDVEMKEAEDAPVHLNDLSPLMRAIFLADPTAMSWPAFPKFTPPSSDASPLTDASSQASNYGLDTSTTGSPYGAQSASVSNTPFVASQFASTEGSAASSSSEQSISSTTESASFAADDTAATGSSPTTPAHEIPSTQSTTDSASFDFDAPHAGSCPTPAANQAPSIQRMAGSNSFSSDASPSEFCPTPAADQATLTHSTTESTTAVSDTDHSGTFPKMPSDKAPSDVAPDHPATSAHISDNSASNNANSSPSVSLDPGASTFVATDQSPTILWSQTSGLSKSKRTHDGDNRGGKKTKLSSSHDTNLATSSHQGHHGHDDKTGCASAGNDAAKTTGNTTHHLPQAGSPTDLNLAAQIAAGQNPPVCMREHNWSDAVSRAIRARKDLDEVAGYPVTAAEADAILARTQHLAYEHPALRVYFAITARNQMVRDGTGKLKKTKVFGRTYIDLNAVTVTVCNSEAHPLPDDSNDEEENAYCEAMDKKKKEKKKKALAAKKKEAAKKKKEVKANGGNGK